MTAIKKSIFVLLLFLAGNSTFCAYAVINNIEVFNQTTASSGNMQVTLINLKDERKTEKLKKQSSFAFFVPPQTGYVTLELKQDGATLYIGIPTSSKEVARWCFEPQNHEEREDFSWKVGKIEMYREGCYHIPIINKNPIKQGNAVPFSPEEFREFLAALTIKPGIKCNNPRMQDFKAREKTFENSNIHGETATELAKDGLYHAGHGCVKCFRCDFESQSNYNLQSMHNCHAVEARKNDLDIDFLYVPLKTFIAQYDKMLTTNSALLSKPESPFNLKSLLERSTAIHKEIYGHNGLFYFACCDAKKKESYSKHVEYYIYCLCLAVTYNKMHGPDVRNKIQNEAMRLDYDTVEEILTGTITSALTHDEEKGTKIFFPCLGGIRKYECSFEAIKNIYANKKASGEICIQAANILSYLESSYGWIESDQEHETQDNMHQLSFFGSCRGRIEADQEHDTQDSMHPSSYFHTGHDITPDEIHLNE